MDLALTFDDVALVPQYSNLESRSGPSLETWLTKNLTTFLPFIPSNMDTVISPEIAEAMTDRMGTWILHRFTNKDVVDILEDYPNPIILSVGIKPEKTPFDIINKLGDRVIALCIDVAHAHSEATLKMISFIKDNVGDIDVIAGNVCTSDGYRDLVNAGADAVKVGVGCGAACTTRMVTGFGVPQFTAIRNCAKAAQKLRVPIIADGGIRNSRDAMLALAAGASTVMMGKMFAATTESAAKVHETMCDGHRMKKYRGQASFDFQQEFYGEVRHAPEGEAMLIKETGSVVNFIDEFSKQLKAGLTYGGARDIKELQRKAEFVRVTPTYQMESGTRP